MNNNPYQILGVPYNASLSDIKATYRLLVKKYHPDAGGDQEKILAINAAWELLKDKKNREHYSKIENQSTNQSSHINLRMSYGIDQDKAIDLWLKFVYLRIDRLMGEIINSYQKQLKDLSADPYDDILMETFCEYIENSQKKIKKVQEIYQSIPTPTQARNFSLSLYQCFSEIQDGINEWERYTSGYVENYLHDGNEMLRKAKSQRLILQKEKKCFAR